MDDTKIVRLAEESAQYLTKRWGNRHDWRQILGACWEGIQRAIQRGATHEFVLRKAAHDAAATYLTWDGRGGWGRNHHGRPRRLLPVSTVSHGGSDDDDGLPGSLQPPTCDRHNPDRRLLSLWCETRAERSAWPLRKRVMVYLYTVEGLTMKEIGAAFGVGAACIHALITPLIGSCSSLGGQRIGDRHRTRESAAMPN